MNIGEDRKRQNWIEGEKNIGKDNTGEMKTMIKEL